MSELPPIEQWWPKLSLELKHEVLEDLTAPLSTDVITAINSILADDGVTVDEGAHPIRLDGAERGFIRTQVEQVD